MPRRIEVLEASDLFGFNLKSLRILTYCLNPLGSLFNGLRELFLAIEANDKLSEIRVNSCLVFRRSSHPCLVTGRFR